jgi:1,4-dihydroxy-2-naphthoyl-CoA hydrolase
MFKYQTAIRLRDTDATGVIYFAEQFRIALEAFEAFLKDRSFSLAKLLSTDYLMPVVHAEGDYFSELRVGDEIEVSLSFGKIGTSSFAVDYELFRGSNKQLAGKVRIVHAFIKKGESLSAPIPDEFRCVFV